MKMPKLDNYTNLILALLAVLVLALGAYYFLFGFDFARQGSQRRPGDIVFTKTDLDLGQDPEGFPAGMPIEGGVKVLQNYNASTSDGRKQATKVLETRKTPAENLKIYLAYAKSAGWTVMTQNTTEETMLLYASKDNDRLQIYMSKDNAKNVSTLSISVTSNVR